MKKVKCLICGGELKFVFNGFDLLYKTTEKNFPIYRCQTCLLEIINPLPSPSQEKVFYSNNYYSYYKQTDKNFFLKLREKIVENAYTKNSKKDLMYILAVLAKALFQGLPLRRLGKGRFLDVGCGNDYNIEILKKYGWQAKGFEVGERKIVGEVFFDTDIKKVNFRQKFDYIRVWHVLEHVRNPDQFLDKLYSLLEDQGRVVFGLPNTKSFYAMIFGKYWYNRDIPRHLINYNVDNLKIILSRHGFNVEKVKYLSTGGFVGSIQHLINDKFGLKINLINSWLLIFLFLPLDLLSNLFKRADVIVVEAAKK